jgi:hypothetical protein
VEKNGPVTQNEDFFRQAVPHASLTKLSTQIIEVLGSWNLESLYRDRDNKPILACGARPTLCLLGLRTKVQKSKITTDYRRAPGAWSIRQKRMPYWGHTAMQVVLSCTGSRKTKELTRTTTVRSASQSRLATTHKQRRCKQKGSRRECNRYRSCSDLYCTLVKRINKSQH